MNILSTSLKWFSDKGIVTITVKGELYNIFQNRNYDYNHSCFEKCFPEPYQIHMPT